MAFLTKEQKDALGPLLHIGIFAIAAAAGCAIAKLINPMGSAKRSVVHQTRPPS